MAIKVPISFKDKEKPLYDFLMDKGKLSPSIYVKMLLEKEMEGKETKETKKTEGAKDLLDFF